MTAFRYCVSNTLLLHLAANCLKRSPFKLLFCIIALIFLCRGSDEAMRNSMFLLKAKGNRLTKNLLHEKNVASILDCAHHCLAENGRCKSFNYERQQSCKNGYKCQLCNETKDSMPDSLLTDDAFDYYEPVQAMQKEKKKEQTKKKKVMLVTWPSGTYGLPKAKTGCPSSGGVQWAEGWREQDLENDEPHETEISSGSHMDARLRGNDIIRHFCMKTNRSGSSIKRWPNGFYCIYKKGDCPARMVKGLVRWDDEDSGNRNRKKGELPDGDYVSLTNIEYCCQKSGHWYNSVELPVDRPFYLLPQNSTRSPKCQLVKWALTSLEYIVYDTEDSSNNDEFSGSHVFVKKNGSSLLKAHYCYYEGCQYNMTDPYGSFSSPNYLSPVRGYPQFQYCSWLISVNETFVISLNFTSFNFGISNCDKHFVRVYDGLNEKAPIRATYCSLNGTSESAVISSSNNVYVVANFGSYSGNAKVSLGFHAKYSTHLKSTGENSQSAILQGNQRYIALLKDWLPFEYNRSKLCYRATRDGWASSNFHSRCDNKAPTVTIVKVGQYIFGGYTDKSWGGTGYIRSTESFIFSLRNYYSIGPFKAAVYRNDYAIYRDSRYGPTFGDGHDLYISSYANSNYHSYTDFSYTYKPPPGNSYHTRALLSGSLYFSPSEVEVFFS